jgi:hypothetical protein
VKEFVVSRYPQWTDTLASLGQDGLTELYVNDYTKEQSLGFHTDHKTSFGEIILGIF